MKTFVFTKTHNYGGRSYEAETKIELPEERAAVLASLKPAVGYIEEVEQKAKKSGRKAGSKNND